MILELLQLIRISFADEKPPDRPITPHRCSECDEVDELLGGRVWSDVADNFPGYCHDVFPLLNTVAQRYYLPAFMTAALGPDCNLQGISIESALVDGRLIPEDFSAIQCQAIAMWIDECSQREDIPTQVAERWRVAGISES